MVVCVCVFVYIHTHIYTAISIGHSLHFFKILFYLSQMQCHLFYPPFSTFVSLISSKGMYMYVCVCVFINHVRAGWGLRGHLPYFPKENLKPITGIVLLTFLKPRKVKRLAQGHSVCGRIGQCLNSGFFLLFQAAFPLLALICSSL